jgi:aspartate/methionine/tyrosine aminotransferase
MGIDKIYTLLNQNPSHSQLQPIYLAFGQSNFPIWEYVDLSLHAKEVQNVLGYGDIRGQIELREQISSFYSSTLDVNIPAARILITDGATGALALALKLLVRSGSEVIIPAVGYSAYSRIVRVFGGIPIRAPLDAEFNLDPHRLPNLITAKTTAIIVNSPGNPHGNIASLEMLGEIASLGIPVIFDEVYQCMTFTDSVAPSATQLPEEHFVINGFSKSFAVPGLRMGFLIVPSCYVEVAESLKVLLNICPNLPGQLLGKRLLERSDAVLDAHRRYLRSSRDIFLAAASCYSLPLLNHPLAGFYSIIDLPKHIDSMTAACTLATEYAVATAPGTDFAEKDPRFLRVNFAGSPADVKEAMGRIAKYLQNIEGYE